MVFTGWRSDGSYRILPIFVSKEIEAMSEAVNAAGWSFNRVGSEIYAANKIGAKVAFEVISDMTQPRPAIDRLVRRAYEQLNTNGEST